MHIFHLSSPSLVMLALGLSVHAIIARISTSVVFFTALVFSFQFSPMKWNFFFFSHFHHRVCSSCRTNTFTIRDVTDCIAKRDFPVMSSFPLELSRVEFPRRPLLIQQFLAVHCSVYFWIGNLSVGKTVEFVLDWEIFFTNFFSCQVAESLFWEIWGKYSSVWTLPATIWGIFSKNSTKSQAHIDEIWLVRTKFQGQNTTKMNYYHRKMWERKKFEHITKNKVYKNILSTPKKV